MSLTTPPSVQKLQTALHVIGEGDAVILKTITAPKLGDFRELLSQARTEAKRAGIKKTDLKSAISKVRRRAK